MCGIPWRGRCASAGDKATSRLQGSDPIGIFVLRVRFELDRRVLIIDDGAGTPVALDRSETIEQFDLLLPCIESEAMSQIEYTRARTVVLEAIFSRLPGKS
jgi:hypothetical protein